MWQAATEQVGQVRFDLFDSKAVEAVEIGLAGRYRYSGAPTEDHPPRRTRQPERADSCRDIRNRKWLYRTGPSEADQVPRPDDAKGPQADVRYRLVASHSSLHWSVERAGTGPSSGLREVASRPDCHRFQVRVACASTSAGNEPTVSGGMANHGVLQNHHFDWKAQTESAHPLSLGFRNQKLGYWSSKTRILLVIIVPFQLKRRFQLGRFHWNYWIDTEGRLARNNAPVEIIYQGGHSHPKLISIRHRNRPVVSTTMVVIH